MGRAFPFLASLLVVLALSQGGGVVWAQDLAVGRMGAAEVPVYEDNLDAAKSRAVLEAQHDALRRLLGELVAQEWLTLFDAEVRRRILSRPQRYIGSYRVEKLAASPDRTRYSALLATQVSQGRLVQDLRALALPLKNGPIHPLTLLYREGDPAFSDPSLLREVLAPLRRRLALLNFDLRTTVALASAQADLFENPVTEPAARGDFLRRQGTAAGMFLGFQAPAGAGDKAPALRVRLVQAGTGALLANFVISGKPSAQGLAAGGGRFRRAFLDDLLPPLLTRLQPGGVTAPGAATGVAATLKLRVIGFDSVEGQEAFERAFFRSETGFANLALYQMQGDAVTYRGNYSGDRRLLEQTLPGKDFSIFRIQHVFWFNDVLELDVIRTSDPPRAEMELFPPTSLPPAVERNFQLFREEFPNLAVEKPAFGEVEDNGWLRRANLVPLEHVVYGYVDSRGDADFFVVEELAEKEELTIGWYRLGRTNLNPSLRLYDETGEPVRQYVPRNYVEVQYKVPPGQHTLNIEVGDRYRGLKGDAGGYLNYHYLLWVRRKAGR